MNQRIIYLDVIRIIACMMVIIMHAPIPGADAEGHGPFLVLISYLTVPCVPLFFMVSGSLLLPCRKEVTAIGYLKKTYRESSRSNNCLFLSLYDY